LIHFDKVSKSYSNRKTALSDISFNIESKEFVCLVGQSGAGKSTIVKLINMEETPTSGKIVVGVIDYDDFPKKSIPFLRRKI